MSCTFRSLLSFLAVLLILFLPATESSAQTYSGEYVKLQQSQIVELNERLKQANETAERYRTMYDNVRDTNISLTAQLQVKEAVIANGNNEIAKLRADNEEIAGLKADIRFLRDQLQQCEQQHKEPQPHASKTPIAVQSDPPAAEKCDPIGSVTTAERGNPDAGFLLLRMPAADNTTVKLGSVSVPPNGHAYQLIRVPVSAYDRVVQVTVNQTLQPVHIYRGRVTNFDCDKGTLF